MKELLKTFAFAAAALALAVTAAVVEPESAAPEIFSDQGEPFYPDFKDPQAVRAIEVVDYEESSATARPFQVAFEKGRWVLPSHHNYAVDAGEQLTKTAAALIDLRKDLVRSDSPLDHGRFGVIDPLDSKVPDLTGRGKRVTLRDARKDVLADFILGKPVEGRPGFRYVRIPGQKRTYAVKTDADPSADFADWVNAALVRVPASSIRKITVNSYSIDERMGVLSNVRNVTITQEKGRWSEPGGAAIAAALDNLRIVDVRPKPASLADGLKNGKIEMTLDSALALRQRGFFLSPNGRVLANEGETIVETAEGLAYVLRFGEIVSGSDNRYLFATVTYDAARAAGYGDSSRAGERLAQNLNARFAGWFYVIRDADFQKLRPTPRS
jgi:hypothetical protein